MTSIERHTAAPAGGQLAEQMRYADALSQAGLVPDNFRAKPANVLVALDIARSMNESPWTVMSEMSVISGRPSFSAKFIRSRVRQAGHKLRETYIDGVARAVIFRADDPEFEHTAEWDEAKARNHDLWGKGHWRKNPELMLKNRALSECAREACYEVMGGIAYTPDEVMDFAPSERVQADAPVAATRAQRPAAKSNSDAAKQALHVDQPAEDADKLIAEVELADGDKEALGALWKRAGHLPADEIAHVRGLIEAIVAAGTVTVDAELVNEDAA